MNVIILMDGSTSNLKVGRVINRLVVDKEPCYTVALRGGGKHTLPTRFCRSVRVR